MEGKKVIRSPDAIAVRLSHLVRQIRTDHRQRQRQTFSRESVDVGKRFPQRQLTRCQRSQHAFDIFPPQFYRQPVGESFDRLA